MCQCVCTLSLGVLPCWHGKKHDVIKSHGLGRGTLRDTQKHACASATAIPGVLFACRFSMAAWLWINDLLMAQKVSCSLHELVCVRFVPFVYSVMVTGLCFLSLDCRDCARIRMCGEQLMLYATMKNCAPFLIHPSIHPSIVLRWPA